MGSIWRISEPRGAVVAALSDRRRGRRSRWWVAPLLIILMLAPGCSVTVGGAARPAPNLTARPLDGQTLERVLLGRSALSRLVGEPLELDPRFPPVSGGPQMLRGDKSAWSGNCLGVAVMMQGTAYRSANVKDVSLKTWRPAAKAAGSVTRVKEAAISLPTAADANALFATFSRRWQECDGKTVPSLGGTLPLQVKVSNVQTATSVVAATISMEWSALALALPSVPAARAIGVRDNCLLEVEVDFFSRRSASQEGSGDIDASALNIAQVMRDKVSALS